MISFTVSLTESDWNRVLGGWQCAALKIPGAVVESFFADGLKIDSEWYAVDHANQLVRWIRNDSPPQLAAIVLRLTRDLVTSDKLDFWRKLAIVVPVLAALVTSLGAVLVARVKTPTPESKTQAAAPGSSAPKPASIDPIYERWTVVGELRVEDNTPNMVMPSVHPPMIPVRPSGRFEADIPILLRPTGDREFPTLSFTPRLSGYVTENVELSGSSAGPAGRTPGATNYQPTDFKVRVLAEQRKIVIDREILIRRAPSNYSPTKAQGGKPAPAKTASSNR